MKIIDIKKKYDQVINVSDYRMYLWISQALYILPNDVCSQLLNTLAIYSTIDACRVDRAAIEKQKEITFISRSILPEINSYKNKILIEKKISIITADEIDKARK